MIERLKDSCIFKITHVLAMFWSIIASLFLFGITFGSIPEANIRFADTILGFMLGTIISTIIGYYMGNKHTPHTEEPTDGTSKEL
jgi:ABC-type nitrate/sulfonate/bicarbonate transport system permease component